MSDYRFSVKLNDWDSPESRCVQTLDMFCLFHKRLAPEGDAVVCTYRDVDRDHVGERSWRWLNEEERHGFATIDELFETIERYGKKIDRETT